MNNCMHTFNNRRAGFVCLFVVLKVHRLSSHNKLLNRDFEASSAVNELIIFDSQNGELW